MWKFALLPLMALFVVTIFAQAQESELQGICQLENTSAYCKVINESADKLVTIEWILAGSDVDYYDEAAVNLMPGQSVVISNRPGRDNCLFTEDTSVYATSASGSTKAYHGQLLFDADGKCSLTIR